MATGAEELFTRRYLLGSGVWIGLSLPATASAAPASARKPPPKAPAVPPPLVMIDPGHGGKDPGAIGVSGTYEKQVTLGTALELRRQLLAGGRYRVELTRGRDVFVPLEDRVAIAQRRGAALFVSIHADAMVDHRVRGASVYTLGDAASVAQSAALARRENAVDRFGPATTADGSAEVARILAGLVRQETRAGSSRLAHDVVAELGRDVPLLPNPTRRAGFVVLRAAEVPSVLVEMGFMSNRTDEALLRRPEHRARVAAAVKRAVDAYFNRAPGAPSSAQRMAG